MAKKTSSFLNAQKAIAIAVAAVALGVVGYLFSLVIVEAPQGEFEAGVHYIEIENPRRIRGDKIEIMEFFSYGCIHCYNFDRPLAEWAEARSDTVHFVRTPAVANEVWELLGRAYYVMEQNDISERHHLALFQAIHDARLDLTSADKLADWFDGRGITREDFLASITSTEVNGLVSNADRMARRLQVASVPTIIVNGKYLVRVNRQIGPSRMLDVMDHLIEKELAPPAPQ